jgi:hypothetical protein
MRKFQIPYVRIVICVGVPIGNGIAVICACARDPFVIDGESCGECE